MAFAKLYSFTTRFLHICKPQFMEPSVFLPQSEDFPVLIIQRGGVDALLEKTLHATVSFVTAVQK